MAVSTDVMSTDIRLAGETSVDDLTIIYELEPAPKGSRFERYLAFFVPLTGFLVLGFLFALHYHAWFGDAQARLANAFYVFYSRDPHLASIGFVWNPLTSLSEMPMVLLRPIFPVLSHEGLAANITSAVAMAGACYQLFRFLEDMRVGRLARWSLLACFAFNPMIIFFGSNGMSEALFNFTLVAAVRYFAKWLRSGELPPLIYSAVLLGLAYLSRNEAVGAAGLAVLLVGGVTYRRAEGTVRTKRFAAATEAVLFVTPFLVAFLGWAVISWVIVGHPFEQYSSAYGTASQLKLLNAGRATSGPFSNFRYVSIALWSMAPLLPFLIGMGVRRARQNADPAVLAVLSILGGVCAFEVAAYTTGQIAWAYRYVIYTIAFSVMLAACVASPADPTERITRRPRPIPPALFVAVGRRRLRVPASAALLAFALAVPGVFSTGHTMLFSKIDGVDQQVLNWIVWPDSASSRANSFRTQYQSIVREASKLDALHLPHGAIMVDNFEACIPTLILVSHHPKQFSIPNDRDFRERVGAPYQEGVRYLLVSKPVGYGTVDAINVAYPTLYDTGAGMATLVSQFTLSGCTTTFRLYKLIPQFS